MVLVVDEQLQFYKGETKQNIHRHEQIIILINVIMIVFTVRFL